MGKKYFGTDGVRGLVGQYPITPDFMLKLGWATGCAFANGNRHSKVIIGKDTRISGYMFESALEAGLAAAGVDTELLGPMPTPAVAYLTRTLRAQAGIVISASHNPFHDNGIKFFSADGYKLPDEIEFRIEELLDSEMKVVDSANLGRATRIKDAAGRYIEFCKSTVPSRVRLNHLKIVLDCANGATYHVAPAVFQELGAEVIDISADPNGMNINKECGATHTNLLQKMVVAEQADLGIAFDGDGDRAIMVDHKGNVVDGDEILYVIAKRRIDAGKEVPGVVGTLMSNLGLELALKDLGIGFVRANVGDRYVMAELKKQGWEIGGEGSGHIVCLNKTTTGDGIVAALQVLKAMFFSEKSLYELTRGMEKMPQTLINVPAKARVDLSKEAAVQAAVKETEAQLGETGRVLLRASGTEPVVRVMVEAQDDGVANRAAASLAEAVKESLS